MLIVAVLNGWSASCRGKETRTAALVDRVTQHEARVMLAKKAMLIRSRARMFRRFIRRHESPKNDLLCVGKSLGARNMVLYVLNRLPALKYRKTGLVTIDPCWPLGTDWTPNLNRHILRLEIHFGMVRNYYAVLPQGEQAGCLLSGTSVENYPLTGVSHVSITTAPEVETGIRETVEFLTT